MRYYNCPESFASDDDCSAYFDWFDTLTEAEDAALDYSADNAGEGVKIGTFNLGGPSYWIKTVFA
jgi:hypothetical protein